MEKGIVVIDADKKQCQVICSILYEQNFQATPIHSVKNLANFFKENPCRLLILDLDTIPVDKNLFRKLKKTKPSLNIVGLSSRAFHPELEEAMSNHIYACISKPIDEDELVFWIKSIF